MLCHGAAGKAGSAKGTCRCSVGKKRRNLFEILGTASHSFLLAQDPSAPCVDGRENLSRLLKKSVPAAK